MGKINDEIVRGFGVSRTCLFCDDAADVYWIQSGGRMSICHECAFTFLPRILADAVIQTAPEKADIGSLLLDGMNEIVRQYWSTALKTKRQENDKRPE